jgi:Bacteriophage lambda head decoration protein D
MLLFTENYRFSHLVKAELWPEKAYCRSVLTANETAATTYNVGTILGKVTATGKYKVCVQNASDGSQTPAGLVLADYTVAAATDTKVLVLVKGPAAVSSGALKFDASFGTQAQKDTAIASIEALGVQVLATV